MKISAMFSDLWIYPAYPEKKSLLNPMQGAMSKVVLVLQPILMQLQQ